jgi:hypothetical protein
MKNLSISECVAILENICNTTDCECKDEPPYQDCRYCLAAHALNDCGDILRFALKELDNKYPTKAPSK